jgi:hypothetical protein
VRRLGPLLLLLVLAAPTWAPAADTAVDMGDGTVVVVVDGKARRLPLIKLDAPAPLPPSPTPDPTPGPTPQPDPPAPKPVPDKFGFVAAVRAIAPEVPLEIRQQAARVYLATSSKIAAGVYGENGGDINALNADHKERLRAALGDDARILLFGPVSKAINARLTALWNREIRTIEEIGTAYAEVAGGLVP